jgi:predicted peptidase
MKPAMTRLHTRLSIFFVLILSMYPRPAEAAKPDTRRGDRMLARYFARETSLLQDHCLTDIKTAEDWKEKRSVYRKQLLEMLGLDPLPGRTDLKATLTGRVERDDFVVEKLHFQSQPGLYVTANFYLPKKIDKPLPAILYLCGHGRSEKGGVSYGNKVTYHHHGCWFARNGYACLTIDTLQLGEIKGTHHGTFKKGRWWWNNRGYTPAGVEAWNCVRALDYLESRKEVDAKRIGATGRSGGGIYSWWITAIDDRIKAAAPVAGITDLQNHIVDDCIEHHCDCNLMVNTYRWDYPLVAALAAPRPVLHCNSDQDAIFPLDGVYRLHRKVARIYELLGARNKLGLVITPGPHKDAQQLRVPVFAWFNKYLKGDESLIDNPAPPFFEPEELRVFKELPSDEKNTRIDETFVATAGAPKMPVSRAAWSSMRDAWLDRLRKKCFAGWPTDPPALNVNEVCSETKDGLLFRMYEYTSQENIRLPLYCLSPAGADKPVSVAIRVLDERTWRDFLGTLRVGFEDELSGEKLPAKKPEWLHRLRTATIASNQLTVFVPPRGIGPTRWDVRKWKNTQIRRRFMLLGQTVDGMRAWDVRRAVQAVRTLPDVVYGAPVELRSQGVMAGVTLFASFFEPAIGQLTLENLPTSFRKGPFFLNVRRVLDMPQAVAMAAERSRVALIGPDERGWAYPVTVGRRLEWPKDCLGLSTMEFERREFRGERGKPLPYRLIVPRPDKASPRRRPLLVFLHGLGERGLDNQLQLFHGKSMMEQAARRYGAFVAVPQCPPDDFWVVFRRGDKSHVLSKRPAAPLQRVLEMIEQLKKDYPVDPDRVYVMGLSMGGFGTWDLIARHPERFAAVVPICGGGDESQAKQMTKLPIWAFHGDADPVVDVSRTRDMIEAIRAAGGEPKYTEYPGVGHDSWTTTFENPEVLEWLFKQRRGNQ